MTGRLGLVAAILVATGAGAALTGASLLAVLVAVVGGAFAAVVGTDLRERRAPDPLPVIEPAAVAESRLIEAVGEPMLIVADLRVAAANAAARALLGTHIAGEDARVALRHPAAAERLAAPAAVDTAVELVGIGARDARWLMRTRLIDGRRMLVHLVDVSSRYAVERARTDFVANASHELRTPLASILGFVETLSDEEAGEDPDTRRRFLDVIAREARRMERLVADLISLSRIEADRHRAPDEAVDLSALIADLCRVTAETRGDRAGDLVCDLPDPPLPPVAGDRAQLSQLLHNLVGNALSYGRPGTPVEVTLAPRGHGQLLLRVRDHGDGIAPEHLPRLTERFYRVDAGRSRAAGGTGLGLAIVKHIVERHRGRLQIDSEPGVGTTVLVTLPVHVIKA